MDEPDLVIGAMAGSLRRGSVNRAVLRIAADLAPDGVRIDELDVVGVPLFNEDLDGDHPPAAVRNLRASAGASDALMFFTPEYNHSVPAVTKNLADWLSRPWGSGALTGTPVGIVAATPGRTGGTGVREHLGHTVAVIGAEVHEPLLGIGRINDLLRVDADGTVGEPSDELTDLLREWLDGFVALVRRTRAEPAPPAAD